MTFPRLHSKGRWQSTNLCSVGSTSLQLTPGTYDVTISDTTNYDVMPYGIDLKSRPLEFPLHMDVQPWNMREMMGRVSLEGEEEAKEVSLRVAEFEHDANGNWTRNTNFKGLDAGKKQVNALDPNLPVWVVVHGKDNSEDSSQIAELTRNMKLSGAQVVTLNWQEGASDNLTSIGLEGSKWIESVGTWAAHQLHSMELTHSQLNVVGHSWGSFVAYEIGAHIPGGVKTLVALDPAADTVLLGGGQYKGFDDVHFAFSNVAENSYAFHSSNFGNRKFALTAENSFDVVAPENYEGSTADPSAMEQLLSQHYLAALGIEIADEVQDAFHEHGFAVSLFSELMQRQRLVPSDVTAQLFSLTNLQSEASEFLRRDNHFEGTFFVDPNLYPNDLGNEASESTWKARSFGFRSKDVNGTDIIQPRTL